MFGFLQGFAYGLFLSCIPWFFVGLVSPHLAVPIEQPGRLQAILRYAFLVPFIAFVLWLTSLWGGFGPTLAGWLAGLFAVAVEVPLERRWRAWRAERGHRRREAEVQAAMERERARLEREQREAGLAVLDPNSPPVGADEVVLALCESKQALLDALRPDLASQADRLYTRYMRTREVLESKFQPTEVTFDRSLGLVAETCRGAVDTLRAMASVARGVAGVDTDYVRRRLQRTPSLADEERVALERRLKLVSETEGSLQAMSGRNEAVLTLLDQTLVALSRIETARPQASVDTDRALQDLRRFIERADRYGRDG